MELCTAMGLNRESTWSFALLWYLELCTATHGQYLELCTAMGLNRESPGICNKMYKLCRTCSYASTEGKQVKQQDYRKNHNGSSKAMEPSVACELWNGAPKQHTSNLRTSTYVGDDDTTTLSHLTENVPYDVEKWSDIVHAKRSLTTRLCNLSSRCKYQISSVLSQKVINYLEKFSHIVLLKTLTLTVCKKP